VELYNDRAPVSLRTFLQYVNDGFYPGTIFHRVISGFMIQGGGFTADWWRNRLVHPSGTKPPTA
jgi:cyclophilin family peptidyl-prolyl cis-trans isomerase